MATRILVGDVRERLREFPDSSVQCVVTSPPYYGLRDYGMAAQIGLEETPDEYVAEMVSVFREVRRVLRDDGTLWLNIGDSYAGAPGGYQGKNGQRATRTFTARIDMAKRGEGLKPKDLIGIPWMLAFGLRADGWFLRRDIIWHKPNPMPESVNDRPTTSHEYVFLLSKTSRYFYDADAIKEVGTIAAGTRAAKGSSGRGQIKNVNGRPPEYWEYDGFRNSRSVWTIATRPFSGAHFATMAPELAERCIKAGTKSGDMVLDPFGGAGTTALVADRLGRDAAMIELNPDYAAIADSRLRSDAGFMAQIDVA